MKKLYLCIGWGDFKMRYCQNCGAENQDIANFCEKCGEKLHVIPINEKKKNKKPSLLKNWENRTNKKKLEKEERRKTKERLEYEKAESELKSGIKCIIILPEFEVTSHSGATKAAATLAGGLVGFALASGSTKKRRKINSKLRMAEKGIVIKNGDIKGADLRIPWENITDVIGGRILLIKLIDSSEIVVMAGGKKENYMAQILKPKCKGTPPEEEGW